MMDHEDTSKIVSYTFLIVSSFLLKNAIPSSEVGALIQSVFGALMAVSKPSSRAVTLSPAVPIEKSVTGDHIVCLEDGRELKMLKRHLMASHGMTTAEYRSKWALPVSYPMTAPDYAARRKSIAKEIALGGRRNIAVGL
jgi:predicted transcriptional regulator